MKKNKLIVGIIFCLLTAITLTFNNCIYGVSTLGRPGGRSNVVISDAGVIYLNAQEELDYLKLSAYYGKNSSVAKLICYDVNNNEVVLHQQVNSAATENLITHALNTETANLARNKCVRTNDVLIQLYTKLDDFFTPVMTTKNMDCINKFVKANSGATISDAAVACLRVDPRKKGTVNGVNTTPFPVNALTVWLLDQTKPIVSLVKKPQNNTNASTLDFEVSAIDNDGYGIITGIQCKTKHDANWKNCDASHSFPNLVGGETTVYFQAFDGAGNVSKAISYTLNTACPPGTQINYNQNNFCVPTKIACTDNLGTGFRVFMGNVPSGYTGNDGLYSRCHYESCTAGNVVQLKTDYFADLAAEPYKTIHPVYNNCQPRWTLSRSAYACYNKIEKGTCDWAGCENRRRQDCKADVFDRTLNRVITINIYEFESAYSTLAPIVLPLAETYSYGSASNYDPLLIEGNYYLIIDNKWYR